MLGKRSAQRGMFEADHLYLDFVGRDSFYGFLAQERGNLFRDEDFGRLYCPDNGRNSVPPSLLATALLLQAHDRVSDEEAKARADFDVRWKVSLGIGIDERPFAKSTLQLFRAQLILHDQVRSVFQRSLEFARESGYLQGRKMKVVLDTTPILGRGAVKDTYNLLADGIKKLVWALAKKVARTKPEVWAREHRLGHYYGLSVKGEAQIDWSDENARAKFLKSIVADADPHNQGQFPKEAFAIDLEAGTCTCPAGEVTHTMVPCGTHKDRNGRRLSQREFQFEAAVCDRCSLREACTRARPGRGRGVRIHPQERLLQEARALQASPQFGEYRGKRQAAEHRIGRLIQLGVRQSRYFGQAKTLFQVMLAATVANLTLTATRMQKMRCASGAKGSVSSLLSMLRRAFEALLAIRLRPLGPVLRIPALFRPPQWAFRLGS